MGVSGLSDISAYAWLNALFINLVLKIDAAIIQI